MISAFIFSIQLLTTASMLASHDSGFIDVEDDCSDDWIWGDCVPWSFDSNGCGIDGRQEARREGLGCHIIAFTIKCTPECKIKGKNNKATDPKSNYDSDIMTPQKSPTSDSNSDQNMPYGGLDSIWGVSSDVIQEPSSAGCEYEVTTSWSDCDRNGHKYRSKKLISGPPVCSRVVEEVEMCTGDEEEGRKQIGPINEAETKPSDMSNAAREMARDEPPKPEKCSYTRFSVWSKCFNDQKFRTQNLKNGPTTCASQNTEYKSCTTGRKTGCQYKRDEKVCGKCNTEKPKMRICKAPLDKEVSPSSCASYLVIEKDC